MSGKKSRAVSVVSSIGVMVLTILLMAIAGYLLINGIAGYLLKHRTYELYLPHMEKVQSVLLRRDGVEVRVSEPKDIEKIWGVLLGEQRRTTAESVQDVPVNADGVIHFEFMGQSTGQRASTLFIYQKNGRYFIEQPYNGIYPLSKKEYIELAGYLDSDDGLMVYEQRINAVKIPEELHSEYEWNTPF